MTIRRLDTLIAIKVINLMPGLRQSERRVGVALIEHFNRKNGRCDPGIDRLAKLLGYCGRTIMRSTRKLESVGLFRKTRHGWYSNRNCYEPNWTALANFEAAWNEKLQENSLSRRNLSPAGGQPSHLQDDSGVTQTCVDNLKNLTCAKGQPREAKGQTLAHPARIPSRSGNASANAARTEAERRWYAALHEKYASQPVTYGEVVEAIDDAISSAATDAEMRCRGAGITYIAQALKLEDRR